MIFPGLDLNIDTASRTVSAVAAAEPIDASRPARFCAVDAPSSADNVSTVRGSLWRRAQGQKFLLSRPVPVHGLRAVDLPGEFARYRVEPACAGGQTLSPGDSRQRLPEHSGQRQCDPRLAYLRKLRRALDRHRARTVCRGALRRGPDRDCLRSRRDHDRFVPVGVFVGAVPLDQGGRKAAHAARSARQYSQLYSYLRRQDARCQRARLVAAGAGCLRRDGSGLPGLRTALSPAPSGQLLCDASQIQSQSRASLLASRGSNQRPDLRSNGDPEWLLFPQRIPRAATAHQVHRSENPQAPGVLDQPIRFARLEHRRSVSLPLAGRTLFQGSSSNSVGGSWSFVAQS